MKKYITILTFLLLVGCSEKEIVEIYDFSTENAEYAVDYTNGTITSDGIVYEFEREYNNFKITFPNYITYHYQGENLVASSGGDGDEVVPMDILAELTQAIFYKDQLEK